MIKTNIGYSLKLLCINIDLFRIVLIKTKTNYYTLPLPVERLLKVIIRGLPNDFSKLDISEELSSIGHNVKDIRQFKNSIKKFSIHMITLVSSPNNKQIFNERLLFYISIKVKSYRSKNPNQCFACQRFGHSRNYYGLLDSTKSRVENSKYVNCDDIHTDNYTKCPVLIEERDNRHPKRPNIFNCIPNNQFS